MRRFTLLLAAAVVLASLGGCRTTEANYREAYEKAIAGRDSSLAVDSTIYGGVRRQMRMSTATLGNGSTVEVWRQHVRIAPETGALSENLHRYNVVVGRFKQIFNARSMRNRLVDNGTLPQCMVVETSEPYYYVVAASFRELDSAATFLKALPEGLPPMREPLPFILDATSRVR